MFQFLMKSFICYHVKLIRFFFHLIECDFGYWNQNTINDLDNHDYRRQFKAISGLHVAQSNNG